MKILIEGIKQGRYTGLAEKIEHMPNDLCRDGKVASVGYFYSSDISDIVFVLPKVVLKGEENTVFGLSPTELWDNGIKDDGRYKEIFEFSAWICSALEKYHRKKNQGADVLRMGDIGEVMNSGSLWDIIESLMRFYRENEDYVMFVEAKPLPPRNFR